VSVFAATRLPIFVRIGIASGAWIDSAITRTLYRSGGTSTRSFALTPQIGSGAAGLTLSVRY
jgi:hypothetical protein